MDNYALYVADRIARMTPGELILSVLLWSSIMNSATLSLVIYQIWRRR